MTAKRSTTLALYPPRSAATPAGALASPAAAPDPTAAPAHAPAAASPPASLAAPAFTALNLKPSPPSSMTRPKSPQPLLTPSFKFSTLALTLKGRGAITCISYIAVGLVVVVVVCCDAAEINNGYLDKAPSKYGNLALYSYYQHTQVGCTRGAHFPICTRNAHEQNFTKTYISAHVHEVYIFCYVHEMPMALILQKRTFCHMYMNCAYAETYGNVRKMRVPALCARRAFRRVCDQYACRGTISSNKQIPLADNPPAASHFLCSPNARLLPASPASCSLYR
jgi:hypothetical protein